jgi:hypothetical protein
VSRVVIGHNQGKPIYQDEGPNRARLTGNDPQLIGSDLTVKRTGDATGLPDKRAMPWWRKER